jgi:hypothetical protein
MKDFENLPILWIDDWQQVNSNFLEEKYFEIINKEYDFEKLTLSYYINKFLEV